MRVLPGVALNGKPGMAFSLFDICQILVGECVGWSGKEVGLVPRDLAPFEKAGGGGGEECMRSGIRLVLFPLLVVPETQWSGSDLTSLTQKFCPVLPAFRQRAKRSDLYF